MSFVLGLDPCLFLKDKTSFLAEEKYLAVDILLEVLEDAKNNKVKYLYNGNYDTYLPNPIINVFKEMENDQAYVALALTNPFEYFENIYTYHDSTDVCLCSFTDSLVKGYIFSTLIHLRNVYHHNIIKSNVTKTVPLLGNQYNFISKIDIYSCLDIGYLPNVVNQNDFYQYFEHYNWFLGKKEKELVLTNTFRTQINRLDDSEFLRVLTSLLRGVYFPDFMVSQGATNCKYTIETHSDKHVRTMFIGTQSTTLYRIHSVELNQKNGGLNRICYTIYNEKVIVFFYHDEHCNTLSHEEEVCIDNTKYKLRASK